VLNLGLLAHWLVCVLCRGLVYSSPPGLPSALVATVQLRPFEIQTGCLDTSSSPRAPCATPVSLVTCSGAVTVRSSTSSVRVFRASSSRDLGISKRPTVLQAIGTFYLFSSKIKPFSCPVYNQLANSSWSLHAAAVVQSVAPARVVQPTAHALFVAPDHTMFRIAKPPNVQIECSIA
jgi:hypothetical protein